MILIIYDIFNNKIKLIIYQIASILDAVNIKIKLITNEF